MSTPLPHSAIACDPSDLRIVHAMFRRAFDETPDLVARTDGTGSRRVPAVADHLTMLVDALHEHHRHEDELLWVTLEARAPACALHVGRMKTQHRELATQLDALGAAVREWRGSPSAGTRERMAQDLTRVRSLLSAHLGDEEVSILPVAAVAMTQEEWDRLGEHARRSTPRNLLFVTLGMMVDAMAPEDATTFVRTQLPPPVRALWIIAGRRSYLRYRRALTA